MITGFIIGLLGSLHCLGMCGPIVLAVQGKMGWQRMIPYHFGRIMVYAGIGAVLGSFGKGLFLSGIQQGISILLGILILAKVLIPGRMLREAFPGSRDPWKLIPLKRLWGKAVQGKKWYHRFALGSLNGLLPCGLVYLAAAGALVTGDPMRSAFFMILFGAGTVPMLFVVHGFGKWLNNLKWSHSKRVVSIFAGMLAFLLILRGLDLGIPFLSPVLQWVPGNVEVSTCYSPR